MKVAFILVLLGISQKVFPYAFTVDFEQGFYWQNFPVKMKMYVQNSADAPLLKSLVKASEEEWESAVGFDIWDIAENPIEGAPSGNSIRWSFNFGPETGFNPFQTLAVTTRYTQGPYVQRSEIILNGGLDYLRNNVNDILKKTILHELGHVIGLDHSTQNAIMKATVGSVGSLQTDDIQGGNAVIDETISRQQSGFTNSQGQSEEENVFSNFASCGSINIHSGNGDDDNHGSGPGSASFVLSFILGIMMGFIMLFLKRLLPT
jgi:hypothetical protein